MTIDEIYAKLVELTGPIGPLGNPLTIDAETCEFTASLGKTFNEELFQLYYYPTPRFSSEGYLFPWIDDIVESLGRNFPSEVIRFLDNHPNHLVHTRLVHFEYD